MGKETTDIPSSVSLLGIKTLRNPVFANDAFRVFADERPELEASLEEIETHSALTAEMARRVFAGQKLASEALVAALLHDAGKLILLTALPDQFLAVREAALRESRPVHAVEKERLGFTHAEIGAYLLGLWGLPRTVVGVVGGHHAPRRVPEQELDVLAAVQVANVLAHEIEAGGGGGGGAPQPAQVFLAAT